MLSKFELAKRRGNTLADIRLFRELPSAIIKTLSLRCDWRRYRPNESIIRYRDHTCDVFFIVRGKVRSVYFSMQGHEVSFRDIGPGEMFGELSAIDRELRSADVVALMDTLVAAMPVQLFWDMLDEHYSVREAMLRELTRRVRTLSNRIVEFSTLAVRNRIHAELLRIAHEATVDGNRAVIFPAPRHADIASRVGTNRESVTRELGNLVRAGVVERRCGTLVICDLNALATLVQEVLDR